MMVVFPTMLWAAIRRYRKMILVSIFFFYLGCGLTVSLLSLDCAEGVQRAAARGVETTASRVEGVEYAVLVLSSPANEQKRDAVRMTWGNLVDNIVTENGERLLRWNHTRAGPRSPPPFIKVYFAIGMLGLSESVTRRLHVEGSRTGDLVLLNNSEDRYERLSSKLMASLVWLHENVQQLKYVIKCDDDSFVRLDLIVSELDANGYNVNVPQMRTHSIDQESSDHRGLYWGYFDGRARVYLSGKWAEREWFLCDNYLPYALGGGYVISQSLVAFVARNADMLSQYRSEDVSMGVWTAALRGVRRVHDVRFDTQWKSRGCQSDMLVRHKQTPGDMFAMYGTLVQTRGKTPCRTETVDRKAYVYNWDVLPSMCCA